MTTTHQSTSPASDVVRRKFGIVKWVVGFIVSFAWTYLFGLHLGWSSADFLRGLLQGVDMAHGNVLLNHWYSGTDSYWAIDSVLFAFGVLVAGTKVVLLHIVAALVWSGVILTSCVVAKTGLRRWSASVSTVVIVVTLGLPTALLARFLSASADHVTTILAALLAFIGLRDGRFGWGWLAAVFLFAASLLSDPLIVAYALVPALVVGILDSIRSRRWRGGFATSSAPVVALVLAVVLREVSELFGTYQISPGTQIVSLTRWIQNLHRLFPDALSLLGFGNAFAANRTPWELGIFRFGGVLVLGAGLLVGLACLMMGVGNGQPRIDVQGMPLRSESSYRLSDLLALGVLGDFVTYAAFRYDATALRYLTAGIVFSSILGAMLLGQLVSSLRVPRARHIGVTLAALVVVGTVASTILFLSRPDPVSPFPRLSAFLLSHDLTRGVGDYWTAAPVTLYSQEKVTVRQVLPTYQGGVGPYLWVDKGTWFRGTFQFLVYDFHRYEGKLIRVAPRFPFANVSHVYREGPFVIVVWRHPHTLEKLAGG